MKINFQNKLYLIFLCAMPITDKTIAKRSPRPKRTNKFDCHKIVFINLLYYITHRKMSEKKT